MNKQLATFGFLDVVRVKKSLTIEGREVAAGTSGTVLDRYADGSAYGVDFMFAESVVVNNRIVDAGDFEYLIVAASDLELVKKYDGERDFPE